MVLNVKMTFTFIRVNIWHNANIRKKTVAHRCALICFVIQTTPDCILVPQAL